MFPKVSGVYKDPISLHTNVAGVWKVIAQGYTKVGGAWKTFYNALSAAVTGTLTSSADVIFPVDDTATIVAELATTGAGPFTYQWYYTGSPDTVSSTTAASLTMTLTGRTPTERSGTVWCTVTDAYGNTVTTTARPWSLALT